MSMLVHAPSACGACEQQVHGAVVVCAGCLSRHHPACWSGCGRCGEGDALRRRRRVAGRANLRVVRSTEAPPPDATPFIVLLAFCLLYVGIPLLLCLWAALIGWLTRSA